MLMHHALQNESVHEIMFYLSHMRPAKAQTSLHIRSVENASCFMNKFILKFAL